MIITLRNNNHVQYILYQDRRYALRYLQNRLFGAGQTGFGDTMNVVIRVFNYSIAIQVGNGPVHWYDDWIMVLDLIRPDDYVIVQDYTGERE